jgi:hypothetical protein
MVTSEIRGETTSPYGAVSGEGRGRGQGEPEASFAADPRSGIRFGSRVRALATVIGSHA